MTKRRANERRALTKSTKFAESVTNERLSRMAFPFTEMQNLNFLMKSNNKKIQRIAYIALSAKTFLSQNGKYNSVLAKNHKIFKTKNIISSLEKLSEITVSLQSQIQHLKNKESAVKRQSKNTSKYLFRIRLPWIQPCSYRKPNRQKGKRIGFIQFNKKKYLEIAKKNLRTAKQMSHIFLQFKKTVAETDHAAKKESFAMRKNTLRCGLQSLKNHTVKSKAPKVKKKAPEIRPRLKSQSNKTIREAFVSSVLQIRLPENHYALFSVRLRVNPNDFDPMRISNDFRIQSRDRKPIVTRHSRHRNTTCNESIRSCKRGFEAVPVSVKERINDENLMKFDPIIKMSVGKSNIDRYKVMFRLPSQPKLSTKTADYIVLTRKKSTNDDRLDSSSEFQDDFSVREIPKTSKESRSSIRKRDFILVLKNMQDVFHRTPFMTTVTFSNFLASWVSLGEIQIKLFFCKNSDSSSNSIKTTPTIASNDRQRFFMNVNDICQKIECDNLNHPNFDIQDESRKISQSFHAMNSQPLSPCKNAARRSDFDFHMNTCQSCLRLMFWSSLTTISSNLCMKIQCLSFERLFTHSVVCKTCHKSLTKRQRPRLYCYESMMFPVIPGYISELNDFEASLVAPRIPFMKLRSEINPGKQFSIIGNVHNIEIDLEQSLKTIQELTGNSASIFLRVKRKWEFTRAYMDGILDIQKIKKALQYLLGTPMYTEEGISVDLKNFERRLDFVHSEPVTKRQLLPQQVTYANFNYDQADIVPAENGFYKDLVLDRNGEWLTFPKIYCGKKMDYRSLSYKEQCHSEFLRDDFRCRKSIQKIFYSYMKLVAISIQSSINLHFVKCSTNENLTAGEARSVKCLRSKISKRDVNIVLRAVPTSPKYWCDRKRNLVGMIKQLGPPSFFITLSPEERNDKELVKFLMRHSGVDNVTFKDLHKKVVEKLIAEDPVMVAQYSQRKFKKIINKFILSDDGVFKENFVKDYFYRVEFQKRGSPHIHMLIWCECVDVSNLSDAEIVNFANKYISIDRPANNLLLSNDEAIDMSTQIHRHLSNCKAEPKNVFEICKKGFPKFIIDETTMLIPTQSHAQNTKHLFNFERIRILHENIARQDQNNIDERYPFERILLDLQLTREQYLAALAVSVKNRTIIMKRKASEIMVNNYNQGIFKEHRSNMDIQIITDPYGLAEYITSYMMKDQFEKVKILDEVVEEIKKSRFPFKKQLEIVKTKYQNLTKVSAQECAWTLLSFPFCVSSRTFSTINTQKAEYRKRILKNRKKLFELEAGSTDIYETSVQEYYSIRPFCLEDVCLADFVTGFSVNRCLKEFRENERLAPDEGRLDSATIVKFRKTEPRKILKEIYKSINDNTESFITTKIKLFLPWRDEFLETEDLNILQTYQEKLGIITKNEQIFKHKFNDDFEIAMLQANETALHVAEKLPSMRIQTITNLEDLEEERGFQVSIDSPATTAYRSDKHTVHAAIHEIQIMPSDEKQRFFGSMNPEQKRYLSILERQLRLKSTFHHLVLGSAGTGKSFLIRGIVQKFAEIFPNADATLILAAQTGKAAFNIGGVTLHTAFGVPLQCKKLPQLSEATLKKFQSEYKNLKLIILDEISLVGEKMFSCINLRLQQIFCSNEHFGGVSVVCVGDFQQLRPVKDNWIFSRTQKLSNEQWEIFRWYEITEIMRQRDDRQWAQILTKIAKYHFFDLASEEIRILESRIFERSQIPSDAVYLCYSNSEVEEMNQIKIRDQAGDTIQSFASDKITSENATPAQMNRALQSLRRNRNYMETGLLASVLNIKIGVKYMLTRNIDVSDGLVNGAVGVCRHLILATETEKENSPCVKRIYLEFHQKEVGMKLKKSDEHSIQKTLDNVPNEDWVAINCDRITINKNVSGKDVKIKRIQIPVVECEALTIHKSQGQTYQSIALNIGKPLDRRLLYVALSRVPSIQGVFLYGAKSIVPLNIKHMTNEQKEAKKLDILKIDPFEQEKTRSTEKNNWLYQ